MDEAGEHVEGRPWKTVGRFDDYRTANATRTRLLEDPELQVKVHRCGTGGKLFSVKTRVKELKKSLDKKKKKK
tara:strand:- start:753 stop:971 length:219 start_codon:yes stop_codon:yes gene_type:complete